MSAEKTKVEQQPTPQPQPQPQAPIAPPVEEGPAPHVELVATAQSKLATPRPPYGELAMDQTPVQPDNLTMLYILGIAVVVGFIVAALVILQHH